MKPFYIAIDFDGTIVEHEYPEIGPDVPGALEWIKRFTELGATIILWTMRSGETLKDAVRYLNLKGIHPLVNANPTQVGWTTSPKAYAHVYIDDAAAGCPMIESKKMNGRPMVDWSKIGPLVEAMIPKGK